MDTQPTIGNLKSAALRCAAQAVWMAAALVGVLTGCAEGYPTVDGGAEQAAVAGQVYTWNFDHEKEGTAPGDWTTVVGTWAVAADPSAPSPPKIVRQSGKFLPSDWPRAIVRTLAFGDARVEIRLRSDLGEGTRACGLMLRLRDSDNYYLARIDAVDKDLRLYRVVAGSREEIIRHFAVLKPGSWHTLSVEVRGDSFFVALDGVQLMMAVDKTFARGKLGVATQADSACSFDSLRAEAF